MPPSPPPEPSSPPPITPSPAAPDPCNQAQCIDIRGSLTLWLALQAEYRATGDVDFYAFERAVRSYQFIIERASSTIYSALENDLDSRFRALNSTVYQSNFGLESSQRPLGVRELCRAAGDSYYPLQQLSWLLRTLDIECVMNYEMLIGGTATPVQSWDVVKQQVDVSDWNPTVLNFLAPAALNGMARTDFINAMCNIPGGACESTVRDLMTLLMTTVLHVTVPLREWVFLEANTVWDREGLTTHARALHCAHATCCNGTGLLFDPPLPPPIQAGRGHRERDRDCSLRRQGG